MKLSAPVYKLKIKAKKIKQDRSITMVEALNQVARGEGYSSWSLLISKVKGGLPQKDKDILGYLNPGDLMLVAARPGLGKTQFTLKLILQAIEEKRLGFFFTLEYSRKEVAAKLANIDETIGQNHSLLKFDFSDDISANYIINTVQPFITKGSIIAIDYLQLLDQKRSKPSLQSQIEALKSFTIENGCLIICVAQLDRSVEDRALKEFSLDDIRLPNPLDLGLFNKSMFIYEDKKLFVKPQRFEVGPI